MQPVNVISFPAWASKPELPGGNVLKSSAIANRSTVLLRWKSRRIGKWPDIINDLELVVSEHSALPHKGQ